MQLFRKPAIHLLLIFGISYILPGVSGAVAGPVDGIHYDKTTDALTVHVDNMPLGEILRKVGAKSGIKFSTDADLNRPVTMDLTSVPLEKAIYSLVQPSSTAMIYSKKEDGAVVLSSVKVFDKAGAPPSSAENSSPLRRFNGRGDFNPADGGFSGTGVDRMVRDNAGNSRGYKSRREVDRLIPDSDSQADGAAGSIRSALDAFSSGGIRSGR